MASDTEKRDILKKLWPRAPDTLINAILQYGPGIASDYQINTPLRVAHFMAQISHESGGGTITEENMNYTTAKRIQQVWPSRFPTLGSAEPYVRNPRGLANKVYNGRMGNRSGTDDGFNYRGRGLLQLTGRESYQRIGKSLDLDLENEPTLVNDPPQNSLQIAAAEWFKLGCGPLADRDDIRAETKKINGGYNGLEDRKQWLVKWKNAVIPKLDLTS
jgi:putative chitinase